jgi:hypothetical protein
MAQSYVPIQTITVGSGGTSTIEFTNIPQNYTDLKMVLSGRTNESGQGRSYVRYRFNGSSSAIYSYKWLFGYDGNTTVGTGDSSLTSGHIIITPAANTTANTFSNIEMYIPNYAGSSNKSLYIDGVSENNTSSIYMLSLCAPIWASTSAITSITLYAVSVGAAEKFVEFTTATLYGIGGSRATGGTMTADGSYTYHTYTSSGVFVPYENINNMEILLIAGGGGGGGGLGGGGGAGGIVLASNQKAIAGSNYSVVVGAGGNGGGGSYGSVGSNSGFTSFTALGGGGGSSGSQGTFPTGNGGSGGGGGNSHAAGTATQGSGTSYIGYGNNGGGGVSSAASGGGGAAAVGVTNNTYGGNGGAGTSIFDTWARGTNTGVLSDSLYYYGGGGAGSQDRYNQGSLAGGIGGVGGGGNGADAGGTASTGTANTGGGGGGGGNNSGQGVAGGSGLVIIRYPN